jgi:hypothetical protein
MTHESFFNFGETSMETGSLSYLSQTTPQALALTTDEVVESIERLIRLAHHISVGGALYYAWCDAPDCARPDAWQRIQVAPCLAKQRLQRSGLPAVR